MVGVKIEAPVDFKGPRDSTLPPVSFSYIPYTHSIISFPCLQGFTFSLTFFDNDLQHIVNQINLYVRLHPFSRVNYQWNDLTVADLRSFFEILLPQV